jgi:hypothetical protein
MSYPIAAVIDSSGDLYVADTLNSRVRQINVLHSSLSFGSLSINQTSKAQDVTVENISNKTVKVTSLAATANFTTNSSDTTCSVGTNLNPGRTCVIGIEFVPSQIGLMEGSITLSDSGSNPPLTVSLSGTGATIQPAISLVSQVNSTIASSSILLSAMLPSSATGNITFSDASTVLGTSAIVEGSATFEIVELKSGVHNYQASYSGDSNYSSAVSNVWTVTVNDISITPARPTRPSRN